MTPFQKIVFQDLAAIKASSELELRELARRQGIPAEAVIAYWHAKRRLKDGSSAEQAEQRAKRRNQAKKPKAEDKSTWKAFREAFRFL
jgi:uncharacterized ion transporter superfamily protein YfcC